MRCSKRAKSLPLFVIMQASFFALYEYVIVNAQFARFNAHT